MFAAMPTAGKERNESHNKEQHIPNLKGADCN